MSEDIVSQPETQAAAPFVTVTMTPQGEAIATNLPPLQRPLILWMLERAKMLVLTQASEQEKASLIKPHGPGVNGLLRRMGKA